MTKLQYVILANLQTLTSKDTMQPSHYQQAIFDHFKKRDGHAAVMAVAGSGKTTTAIQAIGNINSFYAVLLSAFNVSTRDEFKNRGTKLGYKHVTYANYNGFGWSICLKNLKVKPELDEDKTAHLLEFVIGKGLGPKEFSNIVGPTVRLISLFKAMNFHSVKEAQDGYQEIVQRHDIEIPEEKNFEELLFNTWNVSMSHLEHFDFDDQKWMPLHLGLTIPSYDNVVVDEFQDTCPLEMELMLRASIGGQFAGLGDVDQCIYGFKGADPESFDRFIKKMGAKELPLSICYRCPLAVIAEARKIVPRIEAAPGAIAGSTASIQEDQMLKLVKPGDFVLCRTTDDLVSMCIKLLRQGIPAKVRGRDFGKDVLWTAKRITGGNNMAIAEFITAMLDFKISRSEQLSKLRREKEITRLEDHCATLQALSEDCSYSDELPTRMKEIFSDELHAGVDLMTLHKSKGLQAKSVFILRPDLLPHPRAKQAWMLAEEKRLKYVGITRCECDLYWVEKGKS
jgi:UvrD-like helicase C-terminal domain/UvrD/REP helicase N-terminal domain